MYIPDELVLIKNDDFYFSSCLKSKFIDCVRHFQTFAKGGGGVPPLWQKTKLFPFFLLKASLSLAGMFGSGNLKVCFVENYCLCQILLWLE